MDVIKVLVFKPGKNGEVLTFVKDKVLLEEAIKEKEKEIQKYINFKSIYSNEPINKIRKRAEEQLNFYDEEKNYDFIIHKKLKKIIECEYSQFVCFYKENANLFVDNRIGVLIGETSAIDKREEPNRDFFGTFIALKYNYRGFLDSLSQADIDTFKSNYDNYKLESR